MVETPAIGDAMADAKTYCYEVYTTHLDTDQMVRRAPAVVDSVLKRQLCV